MASWYHLRHFFLTLHLKCWCFSEFRNSYFLSSFTLSNSPGNLPIAMASSFTDMNILPSHKYLLTTIICFFTTLRCFRVELTSECHSIWDSFLSTKLMHLQSSIHPSYQSDLRSTNSFFCICLLNNHGCHSAEVSNVCHKVSSTKHSTGLILNSQWMGVEWNWKGCIIEYKKIWNQVKL